MSERIEVGDLVMVVRGHNCAIGRIHTVLGFSWSKPFTVCPTCGARYPNTHAMRVVVRANGHGYSVDRVRKIPPLSELESTEHKESIPA